MMNCYTMEIAAFVAVLSVLFSSTNAVPLWDTAAVECDLQASSVRLSTVFRIDPTCTKGQIDWTYTRRNMNLYFDKPGPYRVCFYSKYQFAQEKFSVGMVNDGVQQLLGAPRAGDPVCIESEGGPLQIIVIPHRTYYKMWVKYEVTCLA